MKTRHGYGLSRRVVAAIVIGELVFGLVLGVTIGMYTVRALAEERRRGLRETSVVITAALMPLVADQQAVQVDAQLKSILDMSSGRGVRCIRVEDGAGIEIARSEIGSPRDCECLSTTSDNGPITLLTRSQCVVQPVVLDGLEVARVFVEFAPQGAAATLRTSLLAALIVVVSAAAVSAPWTAWLFMRGVVEPIGEVRDVATAIAGGERGVEIGSQRSDEIGELADTIDEMSRQLKEREDRLSGSYDELAKAYEALNQAKEQVEQLAKIKSDFVAIASHELRTPLSVIRLYAEMLDAGEFGRLEDRAEDAISAIASAAGRLTSIVADLMDSALLERGLMPIDFGEAWLDDLVRQAVEDAAFLARAKGVDIRITGDLPEVVVWGDPVRLRQVLDNLLSNAVKYSNGADLVTAAMHAEGQWVDVEIVDSGKGISEAERERLFALFGRLDVSDDSDTSGLGLGLAISSRIAAAHGGTLTHRDRDEGAGSVFVLGLPVGLSAGERPARVELELPREEPVA